MSRIEPDVEKAAATAPGDPAPQSALPRRLRRRRLPQTLRRPLAVTGVLILAFWVVALLLPGLFTSQHPMEPTVDLFQPPSSAHLFGTDQLGQDVFSRTIHAARYSLPLAFLLVLIATSAGAVVGAAAGYFGGVVDTVLMRVVDTVFAFPAIILAMVVTAVLGPSVTNAVLALALVTWPSYARVVRGLVLSTRNADFVCNSRLLGSSAWRTIARDITPNVVGPVLVLATLDIGNAVLLLAGLSFLGLGAQPPTPEWGSMVSAGTDAFQYWWVSTFPGLAILTVVLAFNFLGDSLRDAIDPRTARRESSS